MIPYVRIYLNGQNVAFKTQTFNFSPLATFRADVQISWAYWTKKTLNPPMRAGGLYPNSIHYSLKGVTKCVLLRNVMLLTDYVTIRSLNCTNSILYIWHSWQYTLNRWVTVCVRWIHYSIVLNLKTAQFSILSFLIHCTQNIALSFFLICFHIN